MFIVAIDMVLHRFFTNKLRQRALDVTKVVRFHKKETGTKQRYKRGLRMTEHRFSLNLC